MCLIHRPRVGSRTTRKGMMGAEIYARSRPVVPLPGLSLVRGVRSRDLAQIPAPSLEAMAYPMTSGSTVQISEDPGTERVITN